MPGKSHLLLVLIAIVIPHILFPQQPIDSEENTEILLYRDEAGEVPADLYETGLDLIRNPLNLNTVTSDQLGESGLFTPFQIHMLIRYREDFGELYTIYELAGVSGFRESRIREIAAYITVQPGGDPKSTKNRSHMIMINVGRKFPEAIGYQYIEEDNTAPSYAGAPIKTSFRIKSDVGRNLSMGLSFEKDAGERYGHRGRPEFLSGYMSYRGYGFIKQLIVGNFQLNHGLGLVNGTGFIQSPESYKLNRLSISKLKSYSSMNEYNFEQGIGCRMDLRAIELLSWASYQELDLSMGSFSPGYEVKDWLEHQRKSGLHRTRTEVNGRSLGYRFHSGLQSVFRHKNLTFGSMLGIEATGLTKKGMDSIKVTSEPNINSTISFHGQWHLDRIEVFGEASCWKLESTAILLGSRYQFNDFFQAFLLIHHYEPTYRGVHPLSYASGSSISNEHGLAVGLHAEPGTLFTADFFIEIFRYPSPRYLSILPSTGFRYSCTLKSTNANKIQWKIRIIKKIGENTPRNDKIGLPAFNKSDITRLDFRFTHEPENKLKWQSRLLVSLLSEENHWIPGYAVVQQFRINIKQSLKCTFQFVIFNVTDWDNRIYIHEPGLYYSFNFPVYYGKGQKITSVVSIKKFKSITISGKASVITYHDRKEAGSGNDLTQGSKKWEIGLQLRLNL